MEMKGAEAIREAAPTNEGRDNDGWTALVLVFAGLASAWASFQGNMWDKAEIERYTEAASQQTESARLFTRAGQEQAMNTALFLQWIEAKDAGKLGRARFIENHMPALFRAEFQRWRSVQSELIFDAPVNSVLPRFAGPSYDRAEAAHRASDERRMKAEIAGKTGDRFDLANVILATALFLAGLGTLLHRPKGRAVVNLLAAFFTAGAIIVMAMTAMVWPA